MMFIQLCCDDEPKFSKLPADTLAILNEFYQEQNERKEEQGDIGEDWVKYCLIISSCKGPFIIYDRGWAGKIQLITKQNVLTHPLHHKKIQ
jgi:hypothetical protein